jgi:hypothetical protein
MTEKAVTVLAKKLAELVEIFRQGGKANDFHWWNENSPRSIFYPLYGYQAGQPLFETVVQGVLSLNSKMLSEHEVHKRLMYDFLQPQTISVTQSNHLNGESLINEAENHLKQLVEFETWQDVDIPIANLWHDGEAAKLGRATFIAVTKEELDLWKENLSILWPEEASDIRVIARVRAPGDQHKALSYARTHVDLALDIFRAFCFPFGRDSDSWRVGVVGDIIVSWVSTPIRINNKRFLTRVGGGLAQIELRKHILSKLKQPQWELINKLILKTHHTNMENKLLDSIHWLAESTKPDTNNSKFAKISFSLETLIGGEPKDEDLKVRGITAMLAERAAFIAGRNLNDRLAIDKDIRKYYGMRSNIVHGGEGDASLDDIDRFGELVRRLALALLEKLDTLDDKLSNVEKLEKWVKKQKYTLPNS